LNHPSCSLDLGLSDLWVSSSLMSVEKTYEIDRRDETLPQT